MRRSQIPSIQDAIAATLVNYLAPATVEIIHETETPWSSATFTGARQGFSLAASGSFAALAVARLRRNIAELEFDLRRHVVVDADVTLGKTDWRVSPPTMRLKIEILTVACDYRPAPSARRKAAISPPLIGVPMALRAARCESAASSLAINPAIEPASV